MALEADGINAVVDLHEDLQAWFRHGDPLAWTRFEAALADDFTMVTPEGAPCDRAQVIQGVTGLARAGGDGFEIAIEQADARAFGPDLVAVVYREVQRGGNRAPSSRWSTALLSRGRGGLLWRHLHECWTD